MSKKIKIALIAVVLVAAAYTYRSSITSFITSLTDKNNKKENVYNNNKSSYEYYYSDYKSSAEAETPTGWNIYQDNS